MSIQQKGKPVFAQFKVNNNATLHVFVQEDGSLRLEDHVRTNANRSSCIWGRNLTAAQAKQLADFLRSQGY